MLLCVCVCQWRLVNMSISWSPFLLSSSSSSSLLLLLPPPPLSWKPITEHVNSLFEEFLNAESRVIREAMEDRRVHVCLYFIAPTGHGWDVHLATLSIIVAFREVLEKVWMWSNNPIPSMAQSPNVWVWWDNACNRQHFYFHAMCCRLCGTSYVCIYTHTLRLLSVGLKGGMCCLGCC